MKSDIPPIRWLALGSLGVVFGDIGTSPIYTFRQCIQDHPDAADRNLFGVEADFGFMEEINISKLEPQLRKIVKAPPDRVIEIGTAIRL